MDRDINSLHDKLIPITKRFLKECEEHGVPVFLTGTLRSWDEQAALYAKGRTAKGSVVTKAKPGESWHNYGLAFDVAFVSPPAKGLYDGDWKKVGQIGTELGLIWGGNFKSIVDKPHFEWHPNLTLSKASSMVSKGSDPTRLSI